MRLEVNCTWKTKISCHKSSARREFPTILIIARYALTSLVTISFLRLSKRPSNVVQSRRREREKEKESYRRLPTRETNLSEQQSNQYSHTNVPRTVSEPPSREFFASQEHDRRFTLEKTWESYYASDRSILPIIDKW